MRRAFSRVHAVLLACFLALAVVLAGPLSPAAAATPVATYTGGGGVPIPQAPVTVPPSVGTSVVSGAAGVLLNTASVALALYASRDTWLAWAPWNWGSGAKQSTVGPMGVSPASCTGGLTWGQPNGSGVSPENDNPATGESWDYTFSPAGCAPSGGPSGSSAVTSSYTRVCQGINSPYPVTYATGGFSLSWGVNVGGGNSPGAGSVAGCPANYRVLLMDLPGGAGVGTGISYKFSGLHFEGGYAYGDASYSVEVTCRKDDGSTSTISLSSVGNPKVPSCQALFGGSAHGESMTVKGGPPGTTGSSGSTLATGSVPTASTQYGTCLGAGKACRLQVFYKGNACSSGIVQCVDWLAGTLRNPDDYECRWGPNVLPIGDCDVLERAYKPDGQNVAKTGPSGATADIDGDPSTSNYDPAPSPTPSAGSQLPLDGPQPGTDPGVDQGTVPAPDASVAPDSANCWGAAWSWNPINWVYVPVKCALRWAYVPPPGDLQAAFDAVSADWSASDAGAWADAAGGVFTSLSSVSGGGSCTGPQLSFDLGGPAATLEPLNACSPPMSTVAGTVNFFLGLFAVVGGLFGSVQLIGSALGMHVTPPTWQQGELF